MPTICQHLYTLGVEVKFTRNGEDCGGVSDCEELSGGYSEEMMGLVLVGGYCLIHFPFTIL